jgi:hypothetical protein
MMFYKRIVLIVAAVFMTFWVCSWILHQIKIDSCLDGGGRWNHEKSVCEKDIKAGREK